MRRKKSRKEQWAMQSLLQRLDVVENGGVLPAGDHGPAKLTKTNWIAFFALGLICAVLFGAMALTALLFVSPQSAHASRQLPLPEMAASEVLQPAAWVPKTAYTLTTAFVAPSGDVPIEARHLWWKLPQANRL